MKKKKQNQKGNLIEESKVTELDEYGSEILKTELDENVNEKFTSEDEDYEYMFEGYYKMENKKKLIIISSY